MSCDINWDIEKVYNAAEWVAGMADFLIEEMQVHHYNMDIFIEALDVQKKAHEAFSSAERMYWHEKRRLGQI